MVRMWRCEAGHALIEALVASAVVVTLAAGVAQVAVMSAVSLREAGAQGMALFMGAQKLEQLASLAWTYDTALQPVSDVTTNLASIRRRRRAGGCCRPDLSPGQLTDTSTISTGTGHGSEPARTRRPGRRSSAAGRFRRFPPQARTRCSCRWRWSRPACGAAPAPRPCGPEIRASPGWPRCAFGSENGMLIELLVSTGIVLGLLGVVFSPGRSLRRRPGDTDPDWLTCTSGSGRR